METQEAVDLTVGLVEDCLKAGDFEGLDRILSLTKPDGMPVEVVIALLVTTKIAPLKLLPERALLVKRFEKSLAGREDAEELMRFAR